MADEDTAEIEVQVETETEAPVTRTETTTKDPGEDLTAQFKALKAQEEERSAQLEAEKIARRAAEDRANQTAREAAEARKQVQAAQVTVVDSQIDTIASGIAAAQAEMANAEAAYAKAMEEGNWVAAGKAQSAGSVAAARLVRLDEAKADLEARKQIEERRAEEQPRRELPSDPVEAYIASAQRPPQTQEWLRTHRDYILEPRKQMKLNAAHNDALAEGLDANSPEYFKHVETFLGLTKSANGSGGSGGTNGATRQQRKPSAPVAPVNGSGGNGATSGNVVRLTSGEARAATDGTLTWNYDDPSGKGKFRKGDPIGTQEFARRKLAMQQNGLYDKTYTEQ